METVHPLKALLQLQIASDEYAIIHLPYILASLNAECFAPSPYLHLWTTRINSLLNSKNPGTRWAGLCIARKTSILSKSTMVECGQGWLSITLPMLSKKHEPTPIMKAVICLLSLMFNVAKSVPEFQRQVVTPNVPKFSLAVVELAQNHAEIELKILCLDTLTRIVEIYPAQHKALHSHLSTLSLRFLEGSAPKPLDDVLLQAASRLSSILYLTAGKVGAVTLWRKRVDETIVSAWGAFLGLRSTFPEHDARRNQHHSSSSVEDPVVSIPLKFERLRCCVALLCHSMRSITHRAVQVPIGPLTDLTVALLGCSTDEKREGHIDPAVRAMEISVVIPVWELSCTLLNCIANCSGLHFTPHTSRVLSYLSFHLERKLPPSQCLSFLRTLEIVLSNSHPTHNMLLLNRLTRAVLPLLSVVLAVRSDTVSENDTLGYRNKKERKRMRGYDGAEVFNVHREIICTTVEEGDVIVTALDVTQLLLLNSSLSPNLFSFSSRVLMSMLRALPQMSPASLSPDLSLHGRLSKKVQAICTAIGLGTSSVMNRNINLVVGAVIGGGADQLSSGPHRYFEVLLHPRVPPLLRSIVEFEFELQSFTGTDENHEKNHDVEVTDTITSARHQALHPLLTDVIVTERSDRQEQELSSHAQTPLQISAPTDNERSAGLGPPPHQDQAQETKDLSTLVYPKTPDFPQSQSIPKPRQVTVPDQPMPSWSNSKVTSMNEDEDDNEPMPAINVESDSD